jgi:signal transduction histidine kinase
VFTVEDNGIGVPQKDTGRLFRRFERGSNTGGVSGTGLGLHIVREVVLGHGGTVWIESEQGRGARFRMALPHEPVLPPHSTVTDVAEAKG